MSPSTDSLGSLPPTLFSIYRTCKRETSTVIGWLTFFDKTADNSKDDENPILRELTVRQIADRARKAASMGTRPPKDIEAAFKMVIVNRSRLTKHYESLSSSSQSIQDSTEGHKVFNETLAEAYRLLFPKLKRNNENAKGIPKEQPSLSSKSSTNSFETLAELIEIEEEFDVPAFELWREDETIPNVKPSAIKEDAIGDFMAQQAWMMESQAIIETTKSIWKSFVTGDLTLSAAGWLTNMAQHFVRCTDYPMDLTFSKALFCDYKTGGTLRSGVTLEELGTSDFGRIATDSSFLELTHGCGMNWPFALLQPFLGTKQLPDLPEEKPRRFETYFRSASEERVAKERFARSVTDWVACNPSEPIVGDISDDVPLSDTRKEVATICENHYSHDRILLTSLVKSASRHPLYEADEPQLCPFELDDSELFFDSKHIQRVLDVPLLWELKRKDVNPATIVTAHMLLESGRSFVHEFEKIGKTPLNCRIIVLRRANEVLNAINDLNRGRAFQGLTVKLLETLTDKLHVFISDKTFDLYSQSPWVAGSQMSGISDLSLFIGLEILSEGDCLGAVIHLYNMLQQILNAYAEIPTLEHLKTLFRSNIFACNQEPRRTFGNTFELFRGGAKTFKDPKTGISIIYQNKRRKASRREEEIISKFSLARMSLAAHESYFNAYALRIEFMDRLGVDPKVLRRCVKTRSKDVFDNYPPSDLVQRAREVLRSEYDGTLALTRLNCFAVLRLCQDILLGIAARFKALGTAAWPPEPPPEISKLGLFDTKEVNIQNGLYCIYLTMRCVDGGWDGGWDGSLKNQVSLKQIKDAMLDLPPVVVMRDVVAEVCEGKNVEHFLWKNV